MNDNETDNATIMLLICLCCLKDDWYHDILIRPFMVHAVHNKVNNDKKFTLRKVKRGCESSCFPECCE